MQQFDFTQYHYLIMDSSFFVSSLDDALCAELSKYCDPGKMPFLCASSTFHSECRQYAKLLAYQPEQLAVYQENLEKLRSNNIRLYINKYTVYNNADHTPRHDTWNLIQCLFEDNPDTPPKILLLTGNELLLRRVVLSGLPVSIYDFKVQKVFMPEALAGKKAEYELDSQRDPIQLQVKKAFRENAELQLFDAEGNIIDLVYDLSHSDSSDAYNGTEGSFFSVKGQPQLVAKVYGKDVSSSYSQQIAQNIINMKHFHDTGRFPWAMLPEGLLYDSEGSLAGYLMQKVDESIFRIQEDSRFSVTDDYEMYWGKPYADTLQICLMLLREIAYMSNYDILPLDFGKGNFCGRSTDPYVYMLDTCSFCFNRFNSDKSDPSIIPKYADRSSAVDSKLALMDLFLELIHLFVMSLMILGHDILMDEQSGTINFLDSAMPQQELFDCLVPQNVHELYDTLFTDSGKPKAPFSIEVLMEEMEYALEVVAAAGVTYGSLWDNGGHQGNIYPARLPDVLPCIYGEIITIPAPQKAASTVHINAKYLQRKEPPAVHACTRRIAAEPHRSRIGKACIDPLPPVYRTEKKSHKGLFFGLGILVVILALVGMDMLRYSGDNLDLRFAVYWADRMESVRTFFADFWQNVSNWFSDAFASISRLFR